jgi:predicted DNA-binding transcriptional regulator AlpA
MSNKREREMANQIRPDGLINRRRLRERVPVSDMTLWRWTQANAFPKPIILNGRRYWREREIDAWIAAKVAGK